jgi:hypothetical protein
MFAISLWVYMFPSTSSSPVSSSMVPKSPACYLDNGQMDKQTMCGTNMDICAHLPVGPLCRCLCNQITIFTLNSGLLLLMKEKHCELDRGEEQGVASQQSLPTESPPLGLSVWHSYTRCKSALDFSIIGCTPLHLSLGTPCMSGLWTLTPLVCECA